LVLSTAVGLILPLLLLASSYVFARLVDRLESDERSSGQRRSEHILLIMFSMVVGFWFVFSTFFRTPLSSIFAYAGVGIQLYVAWVSVRRRGSEGSKE
jgi:Na+/H+ antiporter NhaD/arsenite permease-like protein